MQAQPPNQKKAYFKAKQEHIREDAAMAFGVRAEQVDEHTLEKMVKLRSLNQRITEGAKPTAQKLLREKAILEEKISLSLR